MSTSFISRLSWSFLGFLGFFVLGSALLPSTQTSDYQASIIRDPFVLSYIFIGDWKAYTPGTDNEKFEVTFYAGDTNGGKGIWKEREMDYEFIGDETFVYRYNNSGKRPNNYTYKIEFDSTTNQILAYKRNSLDVLWRELRKNTDIVYPQTAEELAALDNNAYPGSVPSCWVLGACENGFGVGLREGKVFMDYQKSLEIRGSSRVPSYQQYWNWSPVDYSVER